jgi:hypothetical protein
MRYRWVGLAVLSVIAGTVVPLTATGTSAGAVRPHTTPRIGTQLAELKGSDTVADDSFGGSVAISGTTGVVRAFGHASFAGALSRVAVEPATVSSAKAPSWSAAQRVDSSGGGLTSLSCPNSAWCLGVDGYGAAVLWRDRSWSAPFTIDRGNAPIAVSCVASDFCALIDQQGNVVTWNGHTSTPPVNIGTDKFDQGMGVSCISRRFCLAVTATHVAPWNGRSWSTTEMRKNGFALRSVACASPALCMVGDANGEVYEWNGRGWSSPTKIDRRNDAPFVTGLSCPTATNCVAVTYDGFGYQWQGRFWSSPVTLYTTPRYDTPTGIACSAANACWATGDAGDVNYFDGRWQQQRLIDDGHSLVAVSCAPGGNFCTAADDSGYVFTARGMDWTSPQPANPATGGLIGASCPSRVFCMVVDSTGHELTWHGTRWSAAVVFDPHGTTGPISCPTASFCAATDTEGQVLMWDNSKWSPPFELAPSPHQPAPVISCASPTFCAAVSYGDAFVWNGTSWSSGQYLNTPYDLQDVSCPDPSFCVAIDEVGTAVTWDGSLWGPPITVASDYQTQAISCASRTFCMVIGGGETIWNGQRWSSPVNFDENAYPHSVSCPTKTWCLVSDSDGNLLVWNGSAWQLSGMLVNTGSSGGPAAFDDGSVSCAAPAVCVALNQDLYTLGFPADPTSLNRRGP